VIVVDTLADSAAAAAVVGGAVGVADYAVPD